MITHSGMSDRTKDQSQLNDKSIVHPKSSRRNTTIRMNPEIKETLQIQAIREKRDLSDLIEDAIQLYLQQLAEVV
jgi:predicted HicB family RNase H-like nuclease